MTSSLKFADGLSLPRAVVTEKLGFLGTTGAGKSYAAMKLAEAMWDIGAQFVALDPVGIWWGLRLEADGKTPGIPIPVFGGLHGDLPLEATAGTLIADLIVDRGISAVIDVSQFESDTDRARFARDFAARLFYRKKSSISAIHLFLEEVQEHVPQNPQKGEERMLHAFVVMQKLGRNYGIGSSYISQRPQEVNKKALNMAQTLFAFRMTGPQERDAIKKWAADKAVDTDLVDSLPKLKTGSCHVWSPEFLSITDAVVQVEKKRTFDVSKTPEVGVVQKQRDLAQIDVAAISKAMTATIERAKAEDPKELQKQLRDARAQLTKLQKGAQPATGATKVVEKPVADPRAIDRAVKVALAPYEERLTLITKQLRPIARLMDSAADVFTNARTGLEHLLALPPVTVAASNGNGHTNPALPVPSVSGRTTSTITGDTRRTAPRVQSRETRRDSGATSTEGVVRSEQKILDALAALEGLGRNSATRQQLAFFAGYTIAGRFNNLVGAVRTKGLIDYPREGEVALTDEGRAIADAGQSINSLSDLHGQWQSKLPPSEWKVLSVLLDAYPDALSREELAISTDYALAGRFNNVVGRLSGLGATVYPEKGTVRASDDLFPEGLS